MHRLAAFLFLLIGCGSGPAAAQKADSVAVSPERGVAYTFANDAFFRTDYYFTQGMSLNVVLPLLRHLPTRHLLLSGRAPARSAYGLQLFYDGFTPLRIQDAGIRYGDRPYASYIYASLYRAATDAGRQQRLTSALDLGFIGPKAGAKAFQTNLHELLGAPRPLGWDYQIQSDVVLGYAVGFEKQLAAAGKAAELIGRTRASLGTLNTFAEAGLLLRVGKMNPYFSSLLGMAGAGQRTGSKVQVYGQGEVQGRLVGYNAALQGGLFARKSPYVLPGSAISRGVARATTSLVLAYGGVSLKTSAVWLTPEFKNARSHAWGQLDVRVAF
ncbi:lipid A deacylase LpxR family protein [Hymenobacter sp. BT175]|uniref:lipid A deacylase LpxR family protein n=1 Tax=Hymenobacter translucens TaxID=2886507 RepID=UPI001D0E82A0|nr:lipid A deacylase LpxR family protein [Hymenobacter translucens]MCC2545836.1 lipid A deacylase LpxR family protein [Hymenobacter translucens]